MCRHLKWTYIYADICNKGIIQSAHLEIEISSRLCRFAGRNCSVTFWQITTNEAFKTRKPSHKTLFLKAADIICPSLLPSCGSVRLKPTTSSQRTSRLQAAVGPHSDAAAVFSLLLFGRKRKMPFSQRISTVSQFQSVVRVLRFTSGYCSTTESSRTHRNFSSFKRRSRYFVPLWATERDSHWTNQGQEV